jgi:osmotically inducible protein OsmC
MDAYDTNKGGRGVPIATRSAKVTWDGSLARGSGTLTSGSHAMQGLPVTWAARTEAPEGKTSPEELVAAAHATCFTMALALGLGEAGTPAERLTTSAECILTEVRQAPRITNVTLHVRAHAQSLDQSAFNDAVARAAALCPVSNALRGNVVISIDAALAPT